MRRGASRRARGDRHAATTRRATGRGRLRARARPSACASTARRAEPRRRRGAPARERLPARAARAREGRARRRGGPTSTRSSPRSGPPARRRAPPTRARSPSATPCSARIRAGAAGAGALDAWDAELARAGVALMADRARGGRRPAARRSPARASSSACPGAAELRYRPRSAAGGRRGARRRARRAPQRGPRARLHRARAAPRRAAARCSTGAPLRAYGSQGQQRTALLALLFAERELLAERRGRPPLMLLDDVMSELDSARRELLAELLRAGGQAIVTATEPEHVPGAGGRTRPGPRATVARGRPAAAPRRRGAGEAPGPAAAAAAPSRRPSAQAAPGRACSRASSRPGRRSPARRWRRAATPISERDGTVTVACESARLGAGARAARTRTSRRASTSAWRRPASGRVARLRFVVGSAANQALETSRATSFCGDLRAFCDPPSRPAQGVAC